jgi:hypothetical protein
VIQRAGSIVHIGFHKTGTTSIQHVLGCGREALLQAGCAYYAGRHMADNHVELHAAAMRPHRPSTFRLGSGLVFDETYRRTVARELASFGVAHAGQTCLFSAEGVCLLRHEDEVAWLRDALPRPVRIIACLREKAAYMASYRAQLEKVRHMWGGIIQRDEYNYMEDDSWLWDYDARLAPFRAAFGSEQVTVLDFDAVTKAQGSIVPGFLESIGLRDALSTQAWAGLFLNSRVARGSL